ncbi:zinc dependent phospholipase C family protein [Pedobacter montanisoli]|uniref:Zinc dependent phospholipase C family protein n=1 Tax=Pedobacter montanisoli TaxID=2923277 RepID=A0ABS9ZWD3_9SPHI|nr:zinc dependent phospholipase C family protein [Pedobacter montanisoli]MCJ0742609.1 zinc dependent phospholipase C family protein [Pedobacter montanisoli]
MKKLFLYPALCCLVVLCTSWGFFAHRRINQLAIFTLPQDMIRFYKANHKYITEHAIDPDKRRYINPAEAARHYLDVENYENHIDSIPEKWDDAVKKYGSKKLDEDGIVPWQIQRTYYNLVKAFKEHDSLKILKYSADLGHYIADAHVPLHTTRNHNGQLTEQVGIHAFWESRIPELFAQNYNFIVGKAYYINNPLKEAWDIVRQSHTMVDSVLRFEATLNKAFPSDQKYDFSQRGNAVMKQYSSAYSKAYQDKLNSMIERRMKASILKVGCFWYSAWIDAGQPVLKNLVKTEPTIEELQQQKAIDQKYNEGKILGRDI